MRTLLTTIHHYIEETGKGLSMFSKETKAQDFLGSKEAATAVDLLSKLTMGNWIGREKDEQTLEVAVNTAFVDAYRAAGYMS